MNYLPFVFLVLVAVTLIAVRKGMRLYTAEFPIDKTQLVEQLNEWQSPPELLSAPSPRPVKLTGSGKSMVAIVGVVLAVLAALLVFVVVPQFDRQRQRESLLSQESAPAQGTVVRTWTRSGSKGSHSYHVSYEYAVDRQVYHSEAEISSSLYSRLAVQSRVSLRYAPSHPQVSRLDGEISAPGWLIFLGILPFAFIGLIPYAVLKQKILLEWGEPAGGVVTRVAPTKGGKSVTYRYLDFAGNIIIRSVTMKSDEAPAIGKTVTVLYDREKPGRSVLYPPQFVRMANPFE